ncbi:E3 ubiquitin-protein ligase RNF8-like [Uloborus diversus]|uniref:E3 ubiquitin-protein ligase RNF8-like n=1 Tax=Uloborus diversus TaxID=327109 RepID=UPI0024090B2C|nr:E3 ubiquitin-protein ligase RNF8-like [Uloborus diversus]
MSAIEEKVVTGSLKLISGPNEGLSFEMCGSEMLLGRNTTAPICLSHRSVSRNHCFFKYTNEGWSVRDNKSQNGTYVNEIKIGAEEFHPIKDGDCIYLGNPIVPECLALRFQKLECENFPEQQQIAARSPDKTEEMDQESKNDNDLNAPLKNDLKRQSDENQLQQNKKHCTGAAQVNVNDTNLPSTYAASLLSPTKKSPHKSALVNGVHNQKNKASTHKFLEFLNEIKAKSPIKRENVEMPEEMIDSSVSLIGAECEVTDMDYSYSPSEDVYLDEINYAPEVKQEEHSSDLSQDVPKVQILQDKVSCLEAELENVKRELLEKNKLLKAQAESEEELKNEFESKLRSAKEDVIKVSRAKLLEELQCTICTEFLLKPTVLGCSHTFCEYCIHEWKKKKRQCPVCRKPITIEYNVLLIDNLIDKLADSYIPDLAEKRKELLEARSVKKEVGKRKKKNSRSSLNARRLRSANSTTASRSTSTSGASNSDMNALSLLEERVDNLLRNTLSDSPLAEIPEVMTLSDFSNQSDSDDESMDGLWLLWWLWKMF